MKKFYLVPVTSRQLTMKGKKLIDILKLADSELYDREMFRVNITYGDSFEVNKKYLDYVDNYNRETSLLYKYHELPEKLIVEEKKGKYFEVCTGLKIQFYSKSYMDVYASSEEDVEEFLSKNPTYDNNVCRLLTSNNIKIKKRIKRKVI